MKNKKAILAVVAVLALAVATIAAAQHRMGGMHEHGMEGPFGGPMLMLHHLDLSAQQRARIKTIMQSEKPKIQPLMQDLMQAHQQIQTATDAGTLNQTEALNIIDAHKNALAQLLVEHAKIQSQIMALLTPDQQAKLKTMREHHQQRMQEFMQKHQQEQQQAPPASPSL